MYAGQYRSNPILENNPKYTNSSKSRKQRPKQTFLNKNSSCLPKITRTPEILSVIPLAPWLSTTSASKVIKDISIF